MMLYETESACEEKTEGFPLGVPDGPLDTQTATRWLRGHDLIPSDTGYAAMMVGSFDDAETAKRAEQLFTYLACLLVLGLTAVRLVSRPALPPSWPPPIPDNCYRLIAVA